MFPNRFTGLLLSILESHVRQRKFQLIGRLSCMCSVLVGLWFNHDTRACDSWPLAQATASERARSIMISDMWTLENFN